jgi:hypothetical protein
MIIGICGLIGSGKDTIADILVTGYNFKKISFADPLKDSVSAMFSWPRHLLEGDTEYSRAWREQLDEFWSNELGYPVTPRLVLQKIGTDCMREKFHKEIWVTLLKKKLIDYPDTNWVISDVRFYNELMMIRNQGGTVIETQRGNMPEWAKNYVERGIVPDNIHPSEYQLLNSSMTYTIQNNGTIQELKNQVSNLLDAI